MHSTIGVKSLRTKHSTKFQLTTVAYLSHIMVLRLHSNSIATGMYIQYGTYAINVSNILNFANKHGKSQTPEWLYQLTKNNIITTRILQKFELIIKLRIGNK